jgi:hypothetical protein
VANEEWLESFDPASEPNPESELRLALRGALQSGHVEASPESLDDAIEAMLGSMTADEAVNVAGAMRAIGRQASKAATDPMLAPAAGAALGSLGGPLGTAAGARLGTAVSRSLTAPKVQSAQRRSPGAVRADPSVHQGSRAAARALVLTQHPHVLQSLLALALGAEGTKTVQDVPVARVMRLLRAVVVQAEADAAALAQLGAPRSPTGQQQAASAEDDVSALYAGMVGATDGPSRDWLSW